MGFISSLKNLTGRRKGYALAKMLSGEMPVFSSWGRDVYAYDIVKNAVAINCAQMSKLTPRHVRINSADGTQVMVNGSINSLLSAKPNPYMIPSDFLSRCSYLYDVTDNCYIIPTFRKQYVNEIQYRRVYTGFYPIDPMEVSFEEDGAGQIWVRFRFASGEEVFLPYADVIHWKKNVSIYDIVGGGSGVNQSYLNLLNADNTALQGMEKAVKSKLGIRGILRSNSMIDPETQDKQLKEFEKKVKNSTSGILPMDIKAEYIPLNIDPQVIDRDTLEFIEKRILAPLGVSLAIYNHDFKEEEYQSYYELTLEHRIKSLGEAMQKTLFTDRELEVGNRIIAFEDGLQYSSFKNRINAVDILSQRGVITINEMRQACGLPPIPDGDVRVVKADYSKVGDAAEYQLGHKKDDDEGDKDDGEEE